MSTRRTARVASMVREVVSTAILSELRDPRIRNVTVLGADMTPDLRYARVRISVMGDDKTAALTMHGLNSARGYLQSRVGAYIKSRYTPEIRFVLDEGVRRSIEMSAMLREVLENGDAQLPAAGEGNEVVAASVSEVSENDGPREEEESGSK
jgi:ribosome-binding factor A